MEYINEAISAHQTAALTGYYAHADGETHITIKTGEQIWLH